MSYTSDWSSATGITEAVFSPYMCLVSFHSIDLHEQIITFSSSKSPTCTLEPIPTSLLKDILLS